MWCNEFSLYVLMMFAAVVFCPIIDIVEFARSPVDTELFLAFPVAKSMKTHVHCFGTLGLNFAIDHAVGH